MASEGYHTIYWPIETVTRELDACLLLSTLAAQRGWSVVIGGKAELFRSLRQNAEPGLVVDKSIQKRSEHLFSEFKKRGHQVFARCEEGIVFSDAEDYCHRKTGEEAFRLVDGVLAWGQKHADALAHGYPQFADKVAVTGNVRCDLMSPAVRRIYDREVAEIRKEWGDFHLLNTKFSLINPFSRVLKKGYVEVSIKRGKAPTEAQVRVISRRVARLKALLPQVVEFVERFAKELPGEKLIIRPHPGEDFSLWKTLAAGKQNVHVVHEGSVHPWLLASKMSISPDCTTAVEAFLLDKPGINFRPVQDDEIEWLLPRISAYQIESIDELLRVLALPDPRGAMKLPDAPRDEILASYLVQCEGTMAAEAILDYFSMFRGPGERSSKEGVNGGGHNPLGKRNLVFVAKQRLKIFIAWCLSKDNRSRRLTRQQKFPGLDYAKIAARLDEISGALGYERVKVTKLAENIFLIAHSE